MVLCSITIDRPFNKEEKKKTCPVIGTFFDYFFILYSLCSAPGMLSVYVRVCILSVCMSVLQSVFLSVRRCLVLFFCGHLSKGKSVHLTVCLSVSLVHFIFLLLSFNIFESQSTPPNRFQDWSIIEKIMVVSLTPPPIYFSPCPWQNKYQIFLIGHFDRLTSRKKGVTGFEQLEKNRPSPLPSLLLGNSMRVNPALVFKNRNCFWKVPPSSISSLALCTPLTANAL